MTHCQKRKWSPTEFKLQNASSILINIVHYPPRLCPADKSYDLPLYPYPMGINAAAISVTPRSVARRLNCAAAFRVSCTSTRIPRELM